MSNKHTYIAFLRGINVGGHHKVPMADLRAELASLDLHHIVTLLNTGNIIFDTAETDLPGLQTKISAHLEQAFGFRIPTLLKTSANILYLLKREPFSKIQVTKETRLYVSFLWNDPIPELNLPWANEDGSYSILDIVDNSIISVLDLAVSGTPKGMESLEKRFGKEMTTRNWNTILKIAKKLESRP